MADYDEALSILRRMEQNQLKALDVQAEHLALVKAQMDKTAAKVHESIELQKLAVGRQAKALTLVVPVLLAAMLLVGYLLFRHT